MLGGVGFTVALLIADLAFEGDPGFRIRAKTAVLVASVLAAVLAAVSLRRRTGRSRRRPDCTAVCPTVEARAGQEGVVMADQPVGDIIKNITDDVKLLVRDEIELAKTELIPAAKNGGIGAGLFGAAGYFGICALVGPLLRRRLRPGRRSDWPLWLGFLIVGDRAARHRRRSAAAIGYTRIKKVKAPERTIAQANQTVTEVKAAAKRAAGRRQGAADRGHRSSTRSPFADRRRRVRG